MVIDVLYRAGKGERHGWRIRIVPNHGPYVIRAWGFPERFGLTRDKAELEANCFYNGSKTRPPCARLIVIGWARDMKHKAIVVGKCRHSSPHRKLVAVG